MKENDNNSLDDNSNEENELEENRISKIWRPNLDLLENAIDFDSAGKPIFKVKKGDRVLLGYSNSPFMESFFANYIDCKPNGTITLWELDYGQFRSATLTALRNGIQQLKIAGKHTRKSINKLSMKAHGAKRRKVPETKDVLKAKSGTSAAKAIKVNNRSRLVMNQNNENVVAENDTENNEPVTESRRATYRPEATAEATAHAQSLGSNKKKYHRVGRPLGPKTLDKLASKHGDLSQYSNAQIDEFARALRSRNVSADGSAVKRGRKTNLEWLKKYNIDATNMSKQEISAKVRELKNSAK